MRNSRFVLPFVLTLALRLAPAAPPLPEDGAMIMVNTAVSSRNQVEIGVFNFYGPLGDSPRYGFYNKGRAYNFLVATSPRKGGGREVDAVSYEALLPGVFVFVMYFTEYPQNFGWLGHAIILLNGEVGVRTPWVTLGITNGIHPFFTRRAYHDAGVRVGFGKDAEFGVTVFEQDRFDLSSVRYGIKFDVTAYLGR
jgi:hypothetical protein